LAENGRILDSDLLTQTYKNINDIYYGEDKNISYINGEASFYDSDEDNEENSDNIISPNCTQQTNTSLQSNLSLLPQNVIFPTTFSPSPLFSLPSSLLSPSPLLSSSLSSFSPLATASLSSPSPSPSPSIIKNPLASS
jgi:hypothetical protein